jgi:hypothetical protein
MEKQNQVNATMREESTAAEPSEKRPYHPPTLTHYGALVDLAQAGGGPGPDGSPNPDCSNVPG